MERLVDNEYPTADEFWDKIEDVLASPCPDHDAIDDTLRSYLEILDAHHKDYIATDEHLGHCAYLLYASPLFTEHTAYIRRQLIYSLLQDDEPTHLRIAVTFLLADARENEQTFDLLNNEGCFPRLIDLIAHPHRDEESVHRTLMELLYELARVQKITNDDLTCVHDEFVSGLFDIIEQVSHDVNDPYHYPVIRVLLVLNEQFMVAAHDPAVLAKKSTPLTNKVVKVLSSHGSRYKTFGANIILLLNREDETSLQLLTLKLMYLLFTTPPTYEYFYTNDLHVLVDILVRNLLDLPEYASALRHTYLRVLYPLLEHTQLQFPPYYKRQEIRKLLALLCGDRVEHEDGSSLPGGAWNHFEDVDDTTKRLVKRCQGVSWLSDPETDLVRMDSPIDETTSEPSSPMSPTKPQPPQLPAPRKLRKRDSSKGSTLTIGGFLTPHLEGARQSSMSMAEMAQQKEKPGVITPSRNPSFKHGLRQAIFTGKKEKPAPPKSRRSGFMRPRIHSSQTETAITAEGLDNAQMSPPIQTEENDKYQDAVEIQQLDVQIELPRKLSIESRASSSGQRSTNHQSKPQTKSPPPAPKARRGWRMRKSKDLQQEHDNEPGRFSATLPSINTVAEHNPFSPPTEAASDHFPFSPVRDKTLDPARSPTSPTTSHTPKRSVSDALNQAQEQAVQQVEECLEHTHLTTNSQHDQSYPSPINPVEQPHRHPPRSSSLQPLTETDQEFHPIHVQRTVLAPPGQAPIRAVPGPRIDLEKSPFLSDDEEHEAEVEAESDAKSPDEIASAGTGLGISDGARTAVPHLRTKESWEDFDNEE
ncbi:pre-rRNA processing [Lithohypha guttulata]|nr:pre-rRNA processing [Lithohypha guttulata]